MRAGRTAQAGFTLLELVIVLVIVAVALGLVAPSLTVPMRRPKPDVVSFVEAARVQSIQEGHSVAVYYSNGRLWLEKGKEELKLAQNQYIAVERPQPSEYLPWARLTVFYPDGTGILARFRLMQRRSAGADTELYSVTIDPIHGEVHYAYP